MQNACITDISGSFVERLISRVLLYGLVADRLFHAMDKKGAGMISFDDFVVGLAVCCRGTLEEKMKFVFSVYDMDGVRDHADPTQPPVACFQRSTRMALDY